MSAAAAKKVSTWTWLWLAWLCAFLAIELPAALNKTSDDTLSEHVWRWFSVDGQRRFWLLRRVVLLGFWVIGVGVAHFVFQAGAFWSVILPGTPFAIVIVWSTFLEETDADESSRRSAMLGSVLRLLGKYINPLKVITYLFGLAAQGKLGKPVSTVYWATAGHKSWIVAAGAGVAAFLVTLSQDPAECARIHCTTVHDLFSQYWPELLGLFGITALDDAVRKTPPARPL